MTGSAATAERRTPIATPGHLRAAVRDYGALGALARSAAAVAVCCLVCALAALSRTTMEPDPRAPLAVAAVCAAGFAVSSLAAAVGGRALRHRADRDFAVFRDRGWVGVQVPLALGGGPGGTLAILTHPGLTEVEAQVSATRIERRLAALSRNARVVTVHRLQALARQGRPVGGFVPELPPETLLTCLIGDRRRVVVLPGDARRATRVLRCGTSGR